MVELVNAHPELDGFSKEVESHFISQSVAQRILQCIADNPKIKQSAVKKTIAHSDGRQVANIISWLEKMNRVHRERSGKTYVLTLVESD